MSSVLNRYLDKVIKDNRTIDARGVMQVNRMIELTMDEVFINLSVRMGHQEKTGQAAGIIFRSVSNDGLLNSELTQEFLRERLSVSNVETGVSTADLWSRHNACCSLSTGFFRILLRE